MKLIVFLLLLSQGAYGADVHDTLSRVPRFVETEPGIYDLVLPSDTVASFTFGENEIGGWWEVALDRTYRTRYNCLPLRLDLFWRALKLQWEHERQQKRYEQQQQLIDVFREVFFGHAPDSNIHGD